EEMIEKVRHVLAKKEANRPITAEDYMLLDRFVAGVEGRVIEARAASYDELRQERVAARQRVPAFAWNLELEELNLPLRLHNSLLSQDVTTVGAVMYHLDADEQALLRLDGVTDDSIETIRERMDELVNSSEFQAWLASEEVAEEAAGAEAVAEAEEAEPETADVVEAAEAVEE